MGSPRSGTTLATRLALELPGLQGPPLETHFFPVMSRLVVKSGERSPFSLPTLEAALDRYRGHFHIADAQLDPSEVLDRLASRPDRPVGGRAHLHEAFRAVVETLTPERPGRRALCEKTPHHLWAWPSFETTPDTRFVVLVRDPRAVAEAKLRRGWSEDPLHLASRWVQEQHEIARAA